MGEDSALIAWIGIVLLIFFYVLGYDLWAHYTQHLTMTEQFRRWLKESVAGPIIFALWIAVPIGLTYHFLIHNK